MIKLKKVLVIVVVMSLAQAVNAAVVQIPVPNASFEIGNPADANDANSWSESGGGNVRRNALDAHTGSYSMVIEDYDGAVALWPEVSQDVVLGADWPTGTSVTVSTYIKGSKDPGEALFFKGYLYYTDGTDGNVYPDFFREILPTGPAGSFPDWTKVSGTWVVPPGKTANMMHIEMMYFALDGYVSSMFFDDVSLTAVAPPNPATLLLSAGFNDDQIDADVAGTDPTAYILGSPALDSNSTVFKLGNGSLDASAGADSAIEYAPGNYMFSTGAGTVAFFYKPTGGDGDIWHYHGQGSYSDIRIKYDSTNHKIVASVNFDAPWHGKTIQGVFDANDWVYIALCWNNFDDASTVGTLDLYLNGVRADTVSLSGDTMIGPPVHVTIGHSMGNLVPVGDYNPTAGPYLSANGYIDSYLYAPRRLYTGSSFIVPASEGWNCLSAMAQGHALSGDLNKDCYVDFLDFSEMAAEWLNCNDPEDANCTQNW